MSGVVKGVGKVFKGIAKGVGSVFKGIVGVVKKFWPVILIAAAAVFTAGLATGFFAPASAAAASGGAAAATGTAAGATGTAFSSAAAASSAATGAAAPVAAGAAGGAAGGAVLGGAASTAAGALPAAVGAGAGAGAASAGASPGIIGSVLGGMTKYWPATMLGGQLVGGIGQGMMANQAAKEERELAEQRLEEERRQFDTGRTHAGSFYGVGPEGGPSTIDYAGPQIPGLVASQIQRTAAPAPAAVAAPQRMTPQALDYLVALQDQGRIARST